MLDILKEEVSSYFKIEVKKLSSQTKAYDVDGWDSLEHANFLLHLEDVFKIEFDLEDLINLENLGDLAEVIKYKVNNI